jgi:hypothetical protein
MSTVTKTRKPRQVVRTIRLTLRPFEGNPGMVTIRAGKVVNDYFVLPINSAFGRSFLLEKTGGEADDQYHVCLNFEGDRHLCDCKGALKHGHCKHSAGLEALVKAGKL